MTFRHIVPYHRETFRLGGITMAKHHRITGVIILASLLAILTTASASIASTTSDYGQPPATHAKHKAPSSATITSPARPNDIPAEEMPILGYNVDGQLAYRYVPIDLWGRDGPAEILVDELIPTPERPIYILKPDNQYYLAFDFSAYADSAIATNIEVRVSYSNSVPDDQLGSIEALITEYYIDGSYTIFYGEIKFVVDSPEGLILTCVQPQVSEIISTDDIRITLDTTAGQLAYQTIPRYLGWERLLWTPHTIHTYGHTYNVYPPDNVVDSYLYPEIRPETDPPDFYWKWQNWGILPR